MSNSEETKRPNASFPTVYVANSKDGPVVLDLENDRLLKLNSTALEMWLMMSRGCTEEEIIQSCAQRFDADTTLIREAFILLLQKIDDAGLKDYALVVRSESNPLTIHHWLLRIRLAGHERKDPLGLMRQILRQKPTLE